MSFTIYKAKECIFPKNFIFIPTHYKYYYKINESEKYINFVFSNQKLIEKLSKTEKKNI